MTNKTTMPEPVAKVTTKQRRDSSRMYVTNVKLLKGVPHGTELITTDQAEAYAEARVWEALETAAQEVELIYSNSDDQDRFQIKAAEAVRALITQENKHDNQE